MEKKTLMEAVKSVGLHAQAKVLWIVHPLLEQMATSFADYVGMHALASNGKPLLAVAVKDAIGKYKSAAGPDEDEKAGVAAFAKSLIASSAEVFAQKIVVQTERGDVAWSPFVCSVKDFLASYPGASVSASRVESRIPDAIATAFMMTKIIPHSLLDHDSLSEMLNEIKAPV